MTRLRLTPLGGVGRFGRNCLCVEVEGGPALLVDCGVRFVADETPGFDVGLPDLERIDALGDRLLGVVVTHGHEDHIGGLPFALASRPSLPIWATPFTARLIERRFARASADAALAGGPESAPAIDVVTPGDERVAGPFRVRWLAVSHSIPDATCVAIETPAGTIVHSGDFRVDDDPVLGPPTDLEGLARVGDGGVACLLADSTGAMLPGRNPGERSVGAALTAAVASAEGRVFVALFASHVQRLALVAEACRATHRRLCLLGAGLRDTLKIARELDMLHVDDVLVAEADARSFPRERLVFAVTGSQGEAGSALSRLAAGDLFGLSVDAGDRVVFSARVIPGNELRVSAVADALAERGADVVDGRSAPHVSGHGYSGDLELLLAAVRPRAFVALHGNARNLLANEALARKAGLSRDRVVDLRDGSTVVVDGDGGLAHLPGVRALEPLAAYGAVDMFPKGTVQARKRMASSGVLVVAGDGDGDGVVLVERGISPPLPAAVLAAVREDAPRALAAAGSPEEPALLKAMARHFWKARRPPPEILLVRR